MPACGGGGLRGVGCGGVKRGRRLRGVVVGWSGMEWDANIYATEPATTILRRKKYITIATMNHLYVLSQF